MRHEGEPQSFANVLGTRRTEIQIEKKRVSDLLRVHASFEPFGAQLRITVACIRAYGLVARSPYICAHIHAGEILANI